MSYVQADGGYVCIHPGCGAHRATKRDMLKHLSMYHGCTTTINTNLHEVEERTFHGLTRSEFEEFLGRPDWLKDWQWNLLLQLHETGHA